MNIFYNVIKKSYLTGNFLRMIEAANELLYPQSRQKIIEETWKNFVSRLLFGIILVILMAVYTRDMYWIALTILVVAAINYKAVSDYYYNRLLKLLKQFRIYAENVIYYYRYNRMIDDAINEALYDAEYEIGIHGNYMYDLLTLDEGEEALERYKYSCPHELFLLMFSMCYMCRNNGDRVVEGKSVFISNMNSLIEEINEEIERMEKINYAFSGVFLVSLLPVFAIRVIERWGIGNVPELEEYFQSMTSKAMTIMLVFLSLATYMIMIKMKYPSIVNMPKNSLVCRLTRVYIVKNILGKIIHKRYERYRKKSIKLNKLCCRYNVREFTMLQVISAVCSCLVILIISMLAGIYYIYSIAAAIITMICFFNIPMLMLKFSRMFLKEAMMMEAARIQAGVLMCIYQDGITVMEILTVMELLSRFYTKEIAITVDEYQGSGMEALTDYKERESSRELKRIADGLYACDSIAVEDAFEFLEKEKEYDFRHRNNYINRNINDKAIVARFVSMIPIVSTIALKLILPFIIESLKQLHNMSGMQLM